MLLVRLYDTANSKEYVGKLTDFINIETLTSTKTLTDSDVKYQYLTPSGANRIVVLPISNLEGSRFVIKHNGTNDNSYYLDIQFGVVPVTLEKIYARGIKSFIWKNPNWLGERSGDQEINLTWGKQAQAASSGVAIGQDSEGNFMSIALGHGAKGQGSASNPYKIVIGSGQGTATDAKSDKSATVSLYKSDGITKIKDGIAIGKDSFCQGDYAAALGSNAKALKDHSIPFFGTHTKTRRYGEIKHGFGVWEIGDTRSGSDLFWRTKTTGAGAMEAGLEGKSSELLVLDDHSCFTFDVMIAAIGYQVATGFRRYYGAHFRGTIAREGASTAFIANEQTPAQDPPYNKESWKNTNADWIDVTSHLTASADSLRVFVTGAVGWTIKWTITGRICEIVDVTDDASEVT